MPIKQTPNYQQFQVPNLHFLFFLQWPIPRHVSTTFITGQLNKDFK